MTPTHFDYEDLERKYWKNVTYNQPIYGADVSGSITDPEQDVWNINHLGSILDCVEKDYEVKIEGECWLVEPRKWTSFDHKAHNSTTLIGKDFGAVVLF